MLGKFSTPDRFLDLGASWTPPSPPCSLAPLALPEVLSWCFSRHHRPSEVSSVKPGKPAVLGCLDQERNSSTHSPSERYTLSPPIASQSIVISVYVCFNTKKSSQPLLRLQHNTQNPQSTFPERIILRKPSTDSRQEHDEKMVHIVRAGHTDDASRE